KIELTCRSNCAFLCVTDQGQGIPNEEKRKVFTKFYRLGNEESRKTKGTGLGLYLVNKIVLQHKGHITLKDNQPSGLIFEASIPMD
ncbi:MAG: sensor histidine kinase, partial [Bacteriovorax sp.]